MREISVIALPQFAPLSSSMVLHLLREEASAFLSQLDNRSGRRRLFEKIQTLEERFIPVRNTIFALMLPVVQERKLTIKWFRETLQDTLNNKKGKLTTKTFRASLETISNWRESHVLRPRGPRQLDLDCAAAILTAAFLDERKQGFLPSSVDVDEPFWWCYAQFPPSHQGQASPIIPCPVPLPPLPPGTLLWTRWPTFDSSWKQFGSYGAMRFSSIDKESLALWDPQITDRNLGLILDEHGFLGTMRQDALGHFSATALYRLAMERLDPQCPLPKLPLVIS